MENFLNKNKEFFNNNSKICLFKMGYVTKKILNLIPINEVVVFREKYLKGLDDRYFTKDHIMKKLYPKLNQLVEEQGDKKLEKIMEEIAIILITTNLEGIDTENSCYTIYFSLGMTMEEKADLMDYMMTFSEAAEKWGLDSSTLRKLIKTNKVKEGKDYKRSGSTWLITREAMERIYGKLKK